MKRVLILIIFVSISYFLLQGGILLNPAQAQGGGENPIVSLPNPLGETSTILELIDKIIKAIAQYIAPPIVTIMVIYGAFQILFASGNEEKFKTGRKTILYAAIGYAIILIALGIELVIKDFFS